MNNPDSLVDRLRGKYTVPINDGAGPIDGKTEFTRDFSAFIPPIQLEAAQLIEDLRLRCRDLDSLAGRTHASNVRLAADSRRLDALLRLNVDVLPADDGKWLLVDFRVDPPRTTEHESGRAAIDAALA